MDAYHRHRRNLQLIGLPDAHRRWVLKNPSHLFAVDALLEVYPDALVIQTHRDPRTAIASVCSLNAQASQGWSDAFGPEVIGRTQLDLWARGLEHFTQRRASHDPASFLDVDYDDFVADPLGTIEKIYRGSARGPATRPGRPWPSWTPVAVPVTGDQCASTRWRTSGSPLQVAERFP